MPQEVVTKLRGIIAGDQAAAAWLYDRFGPKLYRRLKARYPQLDTEDLFHDAFVLYYRNQARLLASFLEREPAESCDEHRLERYLWDQACGLAANRRRSSAFRKVVAISEVREPTEPGDHGRATINRDTLKKVLACLREKSQRVYLYFSFRFVDGLSPDEIAKTTGWSLKATYKLKQTLNKAVEECADGLGLAVS